MKIKLNFFIILSLVFLINPTINHTVEAEIVESIKIDYPDPIPIIHAPTFTTSILIFEDNDFLNYSLSGNGTLVDPYIIENFNIATTNSTGIHISGTTKHFIIRNGNANAEQYGIRVADVAANTSKIMNVTCSFNIETIDCAGISVDSANGIQLIDNYCLQNWYGIRITNSNYSIIKDNTCFNNIQTGLILDESEYCLIEQNSFTSNADGMYGFQIANSSLKDNYFESNDHNGLSIFNSGNHSISNNTFSYNGQEGLNLYIVVNCEIYNNSVIGNNDEGIDIFWSNFIDIQNNTIKENDNGIYTDLLEFSDIIYNLFENNTKFGLILSSSDFINIHHNKFIDNNLEEYFGYESQALDHSPSDNLWYDPEAKEGNHWNNHQSGKPYEIGDRGAVDKYPLDSNMNRIPRNWTQLIVGIILGVSLVSVLTWMAYPRWKARRQKRKRTLQKRKSAPVPPDYDKMVDEEIQKAREKVALKDY